MLQSEQKRRQIQEERRGKAECSQANAPAGCSVANKKVPNHEQTKGEARASGRSHQQSEERNPQWKLIVLRAPHWAPNCQTGCSSDVYGNKLEAVSLWVMTQKTLENTDMYIMIHSGNKITVMKQNKNDLTVGGHHNMRDYVKGSQCSEGRKCLE